MKAGRRLQNQLHHTLVRLLLLLCRSRPRYNKWRLQEGKERRKVVLSALSPMGGREGRRKGEWARAASETNCPRSDCPPPARPSPDRLPQQRKEGVTGKVVRDSRNLVM